MQMNAATFADQSTKTSACVNNINKIGTPLKAASAIAHINLTDVPKRCRSSDVLEGRRGV
jgi:hypothetical protein